METHDSIYVMGNQATHRIYGTIVNIFTYATWLMFMDQQELSNKFRQKVSWRQWNLPVFITFMFVVVYVLDLLGHDA